MTLTRIIQPILQHRTKLLHCNKSLCLEFLKRYKSTENKTIIKSTESELSSNVKPLGEKVKETTKTASYLGIILVGITVTGSLFYAICSELFSGKSPNNVYTKAVKKCIVDPRVEDKLGYPITAFGEETRRGRRQHVNHMVYQNDGRQYMRMKFYLKGQFQRGTVQLEMVENDSGSYEYRYLFVEVDDMLRNTIIIEDNRNKFPLNQQLHTNLN